MCITQSRVCTLPHPGSLVLHYISFQIQHDPVYVLTMCGVQSSGFLFYFFTFIFPVALRPTCVMLSRYISSPVAFDQMTLILFTFTSSDPNHSLTLKRSDSTHHSIPRIKTRLIFPCHEGHSTPTSTFTSSGSTPSFTFKGSISTLSITLNVVYKT